MEQQYRKIGKFGWHTVVEKATDGAAILCCISDTQFGGVSVTKPSLAEFGALPHPAKFVALVSKSADWTAFVPLTALPPMLARAGSTDPTTGRQRPSFRIYDSTDVPGDTPADPALIEFLDRLEAARKKPANATPF
ncbi:MAG: hypothetical protein AMXMBFR77_01390 [Phycisphaerales bacterium]|nr:hypothetical protein [Leptolyngbya sp.]MCQ3939579.1 hypothetical protein [cyanobacterium CYA1]MDL1903835.1 hypothetical protein [Synechococcales cyanobacterium CNB]